MYTRLFVGCGPRFVKEFDNDTRKDIGLDVRPFDGVDVVHDLNTAFPFKDNSINEIVAIHVVEHLRDLLHFINECHRVLVPGGELYIETPFAGRNAELEFADPTHVRCYTAHTFINYFTQRGVMQFGYTDKAWCMYYCGELGEHPKDNIVLKVHMATIKKP